MKVVDNMKRVNRKIMITFGFLLLVLILFGITANANNIIGVYPATQSVTIGNDFYTNLNTTVDDEMNTVVVYNITFQPGGRINYTSTTQGDLFVGHIAWFQPDGNEAFSIIDNVTGYAKTIQWAYSVSVNNTNKSLANITWTPQDVGIAYINLTDVGTYMIGVDNGTLSENATVYIYPKRPTTNVVTPYNDTQINLTWDKSVATGSDKVVVFANSSGYQTSYLASDVIYNGTLEHYEHTGLTPGSSWYYTIYGFNDTEGWYSLNYRQNFSGTLGAFIWTFGSVTPTNGSTTTNGDYSIPVNVTISNSHGNSFSWWVNTTNADTWTNTGVSNNTVIGGEMSGLSHNQLYYWNVTVADGLGHVESKSYEFTTGTGGGTIPALPVPNPTDTQTSVSINVGYLNATVTDPDGDPMTVSFYWANNNSLIVTRNNVISGTTANATIGTLDYATTYYWYVNVSDGVLSRNGPTTGNWSFNTTNVNVDIEKEWHVQSNNSILCYINVTNEGTENLTNVVLTENYDTNLSYVASLPASDGAPHTSFTIPYLNVSGYPGYWYNLTLWLELSGGQNGTTVTNTVNTSHLSFTETDTVPNPYELSLTVTNECNVTRIDYDHHDFSYWVNVTNTGNFTLHNLTLNESYLPCCDYVSANITPDGNHANTSFNLSNSLTPGSSVYFRINLSINTSCITNGTRFYNNITITNNESANITVYSNLSYGGITSAIRITYSTEITDVSILADPVLALLGVLIIIASLLIIIGMLMKYGYLGRGEE